MQDAKLRDSQMFAICSACEHLANIERILSEQFSERFHQ